MMPLLPILLGLLAAQPVPEPFDTPPPEVEAAPPDAPPADAAEGEAERKGYRVVRGTMAMPGSAPWQIQIYTPITLTPAALAEDLERKDDDPEKRFYDRMEEWERDHRCGGVLIGNEWAASGSNSGGWALSAAHCFVSRQDVLVKLPARAVRLGNNDLNYAASMRVERVIVHGDYRRRGDKRHDIALIRLVPTTATDIAALAQVRPAPMLTPQMPPVSLGDDLLVTGWGDTGEREVGARRDRDGKPIFKSRQLQEAKQTLVDPRRCAAVRSFMPTLNPGVLCVAAGDARNQDACQGDSGGPLTRRGVLVGLVSGGEGCGLAGRPALYTNVAFYADWIAAAQRLSRPGMNARCRVIRRAGRPALACSA